MAWILVQTQTKPQYFQKKKKPFFKESYDIKICNYIIIVKKQGEGNPSFFEGFSNHNLFFMGLEKSAGPSLFFLPLPKKIILLTLFLWLLTTANYAENHTKKQRTTKDTVHKNVVRKPADSNHGYILVDGTRKTKYTVGQEKKAQAHLDRIGMKPMSQSMRRSRKNCTAYGYENKTNPNPFDLLWVYNNRTINSQGRIGWVESNAYTKNKYKPNHVK